MRTREDARRSPARQTQTSTPCCAQSRHLLPIARQSAPAPDRQTGSRLLAAHLRRFFRDGVCKVSAIVGQIRLPQAQQETSDNFGREFRYRAQGPRPSVDLTHCDCLGAADDHFVAQCALTKRRCRIVGDPAVTIASRYPLNSSSSALASLRSAVSKPSVNQL